MAWDLWLAPTNNPKGFGSSAGAAKKKHPRGQGLLSAQRQVQRDQGALSAPAEDPGLAFLGPSARAEGKKI
eukprot:CAMPEP_0168363970 /NCGR_PEP_ID=MMETSP0228-20121227/3967_1 /TAXON_ID=133427 /ORGANISM="Protoceratium reticulatum, Strain CCCM 535 (=CCMP 1889)" /LENGTH=70 /DNA_ID=CAMNT_0008376717 /DNA_START=48 /DNA_END=261 /DNA_ORIENTATION=+